MNHISDKMQIPVSTPLIVSDGEKESHGCYFGGKWYDYHKKLPSITHWREMTDAERISFEGKVRQAFANDCRYKGKNHAQQRLF